MVRNSFIPATPTLVNSPFAGPDRELIPPRVTGKLMSDGKRAAGLAGQLLDVTARYYRVLAIYTNQGAKPEDSS